MLAFHNDPKIKKKFVARMRRHAKLDQLVQGQYWENGKGCHVGCTTHVSYNQDSHKVMEELTGSPLAINYLSDKIFEGLPNGDAQQFSLAFFPAIPVGAYLSLVLPKFMVWLLSDPIDGVIRFTKDFPECKRSILAVSSLYQRILDGGKVSEKEWAATDAAANAAAYAATDAAAYAVARGAPCGAASAAYAAAAAANAAPYAAAYAAVYAAAYQKMAAKLLQLLSEAPVIK